MDMVQAYVMPLTVLGIAIALLTKLRQQIVECIPICFYIASKVFEQTSCQTGFGN